MTREEIMALDFEGVEKRMAEINSAIDAAETMEELDGLKEELGQLNLRMAKIMMESRKADMAAVSDGAGIPFIAVGEAQKIEVRNTKAYIDAYAEYIKTGRDIECRSLLTENVDGGTVPVPDFVYDIVKTAWEREEIMNLVNKTYFKGNLKIGFEISGGEATIHTEGGAAVSEEALILGIVELVPASIKKWIAISDEVYDLRGEAFLRYIYGELTYRIAKKCADQLIAFIIACGTVSTTTCPSVPVSEVSSIGLGDVATAMGFLSDEAANPVIIMNRRTEAAYKALRATASYAVDPFEGLRVIHNNTLKASAVATTGDTIAIVGDLGHGAHSNFPNGEDITFKFDEMSRKKEDLIEVLGRRYVGLGVVAPDAFVKIDKA